MGCNSLANEKHWGSFLSPSWKSLSSSWALGSTQPSLSLVKAGKHWDYTVAPTLRLCQSEGSGRTGLVPRLQERLERRWHRWCTEWSKHSKPNRWRDRTEGAAVCLQSEEELLSSRQPHQSHVLNTFVGPTPVHTHTQSSNIQCLAKVRQVEIPSGRAQNTIKQLSSSLQHPVVRLCHKLGLQHKVRKKRIFLLFSTGISY